MIYMTFYQELQLNQAGSKNLLKKSETLKEKLRSGAIDEKTIERLTEELVA